MARSLMTQHTNAVRATLALFLLFMLLFSMMRCSLTGAGSSGLRAEAESERMVLIQQVVFLQKNINDDLVRITSNYQKANTETRKLLLLAQAQLETSRAKAENAVAALNSATNDNWRTVASSAKSSLQEIRQNYTRVAFDVNILFSGN